MGLIAGGFITRPVASSNRAPWMGQAIHVFAMRPQVSFPSAWEQSAAMGNNFSPVLQMRMDFPPVSTSFFSPDGTSETGNTRTKGPDTVSTFTISASGGGNQRGCAVFQLGFIGSVAMYLSTARLKWRTRISW